MTITSKKKMKQNNFSRWELGSKAAIVGIIGNIFLAIIKCFGGLIFHSSALLADGLHSFSDLFTSIVVYIGIKYSSKPADTNHPFGHGQAEPLSALIVAIFLGIVGFEFAQHSFAQLKSPVIIIPEQSALFILIFALLIKIAMANYTSTIGKKLNSPAIIADTEHHKSDVLSSIIVFIGILGAQNGYTYLDPFVGFLVSIYIIYIGYSISKRCVIQLMGTVDEKMSENIKKIALSHKAVISVHKIRMFHMGVQNYATLHIEVDKDLSLEKAHAIGHNVSRYIELKLDTVAIVHIDPAGNPD